MALYYSHTHDSGEGQSPAFEVLHTLLSEDNRQRSDEISTLTLPLTRFNFELKDFKPQVPDQRPNSLRVDETGTFCDPLLFSIRKGFDCIAKHDRGKGNFGEKLDTLRRLVMWGCFSIYLHLANSGSLERQKRVPMMLCMVESPSPTLRQASIQSYQWVGRSIDKFFRAAIRDTLNRKAEEGIYGFWETDVDIRQQIQTMTWKASHVPSQSHYSRSGILSTTVYGSDMEESRDLADRDTLSTGPSSRSDGPATDGPSDGRAVQPVRIRCSTALAGRRWK